MGSFKPFVGAYKVIKMLLDMGHKVYIVTARDYLLEAVTKAMIRRHLPEGVELILVGSFEKYEVYKKLNADFVVDDHFVHVQEAKMASVPNVVMISNSITPYNHTHRECVINMDGTVLSSISEFGEVFIKWQDYMDKVEHCNDVNELFNQYSIDEE